jgi:hypothetical protein
MANLTDEHQRALRRLARHPDGCAEAELLVDGFTICQLTDLVIDGLATGTVAPPLLLAKTLQYLEVKPDALPPPVLGFPQPSPRFLADPSFHPENHDLMKPLASGVEASLEIGFGGPRPGRSLAGSDGACAIGEEFELAVIVGRHGRCPQDHARAALWEEPNQFTGLEP